MVSGRREEKMQARQRGTWVGFEFEVARSDGSTTATTHSQERQHHSICPTEYGAEP